MATTSFDDILRRATPMEDIEQAQQDSQSRQQPESAINLPDNSVGRALAPVMQMEKTDLMFWMMVAQTVLLYLIWRKL